MTESHLLRNELASEEDEKANFFAFVWDSKPAAMCEFLPKAEGEHREGRLGSSRRQAADWRGIPPSPLCLYDIKEPIYYNI